MFNEEFFEREYNAFAEGTVKPEDFYETIFLLFKIFRVYDGAIPIWTYFVKAALAIILAIAIPLMLLPLYHGIAIFDISFSTQAGTYCVVLIYQVVVIESSIVNVSNYHGLQRIMVDDFSFVCTSTKGEKYRKRFLLNQLQTRKILKMVIIFTMCVSFVINFFSVIYLVYYLVTHKSGEDKRPLLFPYWAFETDFGKTPIYETAFTFAAIAVFANSVSYSFMIGTEVIWIREIACKADTIIWHIEDLLFGIQPTNNESERKKFDDLIKQRMKDIVQHHNSINTLIEHFAKVYRKVLTYEQIVTAPVICLSAYSAAEKWDVGEVDPIMIFIIFSAIILLFIPSFLCTYLSEKVQSISYVCWSIPFWDAATVLRPYLLLIMNRSVRPLPLQVPGIDEFCLETYSKSLKSAYSLFNMLRQVNRQ